MLCVLTRDSSAYSCVSSTDSEHVTRLHVPDQWSVTNDHTNSSLTFTSWSTGTHRLISRVRWKQDINMCIVSVPSIAPTLLDEANLVQLNEKKNWSPSTSWEHSLMLYLCSSKLSPGRRASQKALINPQCNGNFPRIDQFNCSRSLLRLSHIEDCPILLRYHILILEYCYYCSCSVTEKQDLIIDHKDYALSCISRAEGVVLPIALEFWWPFYSSSFPVDREGLAVLNPILPCK